MKKTEEFRSPFDYKESGCEYIIGFSKGILGEFWFGRVDKRDGKISEVDMMVYDNIFSEEIEELMNNLFSYCSKRLDKYVTKVNKTLKYTLEDEKVKLLSNSVKQSQSG